MSKSEFIKKNWYLFPFLPFRLFFLLGSYYVLEPLANLFEWIGGHIPGLKR